MTTPSYLNVGTRSQSAGATSLSPALPASRTNGNILFARVHSKNNATHSISGTGWAPIPGLAQTNSGASFTVSWWYRIVDGTEAAPTISWTGSVACAAQIVQYLRDDFENSSPFGFVGTPSTGTTSTHTSTGQNTTRNNSRVLYFDDCAANTAIATPSGWTERYDAGSATGASRTAGGDKSVATSGTASGNISVVGGAAAWVQVQIELREPVFAGSTFLINNTNDDGSQNGAGWLPTQSAIIQGTGTDLAGFRFQNVTIPQGATIVSASLRLFAYNDGGGFPTDGTQWGFFFGDLVPNAPAWASVSSIPSTITPTTASVAVKGSTTDKQQLAHDVKAIVQEIVNQATWASGNALRFAGGNNGSANGGSLFYDYSGDPTSSAKLLVEYTTGGGGATLTPSLVTNTQTFYAPTVARGAVSLTPSLYTNTSSFYAATLAPTYPLTAPLLSEGNSFYSPSVVPGTITLSPAVLTNTTTFFAATVIGDAVLDAPLVTNAQTFHAPSVLSSYALAAPLLTNTATFFAPLVTTGQVTLAPSLFSNAQTFYSPTVEQGAQDLRPPLLTNGQTFYNAVVTGDALLEAPLVENEAAFFAATVSRGSVSLSLGLLENTQVFFGGAVATGVATLEVPLAVNDNTFFSPTLAFGQMLAPGLLDNVVLFHSPTVRRLGWSAVDPSQAAWSGVNANGATWVAQVPADSSWASVDGNTATWVPVLPEGVTWQ